MHSEPDPPLTPDDALAELTQATASLAHLHVFAWGRAGVRERHPLVDRAELWTRAFEIADGDGAPLPSGRFALCEYVREDDPEHFVADVPTLRVWLP